MPERPGVLLERLAPANRFAERIREFADRPNHRMDAFSQILSGVQLNGAVFFRAEFSAPWGLTAPPAKMMVGHCRRGNRAPRRALPLGYRWRGRGRVA